MMSAYVELVFDNSDGRLPVDRDEVRLRRSIGLKKDEYHLDRKHMTKTEVMNLLETAGFSKSNPYYVVQQGRIIEMAHMTDAKRLDLLKEIGGTKVYEERRKDSLQVLRECEGKRRGIQDLIEQLEKRLSSLDEERDELAAYQVADRERRAVEYTILDREISSTRDSLISLEEERQKASEEIHHIKDEKFDLNAKLKSADKEVRNLKLICEDTKQLLKEASSEREIATRKKAQLELEVRDLEERVSSGAGAQSLTTNDLAALEAEISAKEKDLEQASKELADLTTAENAVSSELAQKTSRLQALFTKQGGEGQYASAQERDAILGKEISRLEEAKQTKLQSRSMALKQAQDAKKEIADIARRIEASESEINKLRQEAEDTRAQSFKVHSERDELQNKQKNLWRREDELKRSHDQQKEELRRWDKVMESAAPREVTRGLNSVKRLVTQHGIEGVYGTLMELFECPPKLNTAVETVAGNSLFHIVVETDTVATQLTELLIKEKSGRATFVPLNRMAVEDVQYPTEWGKDVMPLLKCLTFEDKFAPAIKQVFGKAVICRSLQLATEVARTTDRVNCVTMDGDQVERRGALRGGFVDTRKSRLEAMREYKVMSSTVEKTEKEIQAIQDELAELSQQITEATSNLSKLSTKLEHLKAAQDPIRSQIRAHYDRQGYLNGQLSEKDRLAIEMSAGVGAIEADIAARKAILGTQLKSDLTAGESKEITQIQGEIQSMKMRAVDARAQRAEAQAKVESLEALLSSNLRRRANDLREKLSAGASDSNSFTLQAKKVELETVSQELKSAIEREKTAEATMESTEKRIKAIKTSKDKMIETSAADERNVEDQQKRLESLNQRKAQLITKRVDLERRVRELGTLPANAYENHRDASMKQLHTVLQKANAEIKKFAHVNQKALDQYVSFSEQRDELTRRKKENDVAESKIKQLIETLDMRKDEAIERTFKQVALNFRQVFSALVPGGRGELVMQKALPMAMDEDEDAGNDRNESSIERYSGVKVKVSFGTGEIMSMKQLSGGQKTLVALALIFSIQRCDPAPFYLFDEIDAALDPQYRTTVAHMLKEQANDDQNPAQFIVTTFHPQIVQVADRIYGASHRHRISTVVQVEKEDALEFLQAEEKKGATATAPVGAKADMKRMHSHDEENQENIPTAMELDA